MPRFAILAHDHPTPHWDLFLEAGRVLRSWRLLAELVPDQPIPAEPTADHRLLYLDYEGPVAGGRGSVRRIDAGSFARESDTADRVIIAVAGTRFIGRLHIERVGEGWTCTFVPA